MNNSRSVWALQRSHALGVSCGLVPQNAIGGCESQDVRGKLHTSQDYRRDRGLLVFFWVEVFIGNYRKKAEKGRCFHKLHEQCQESAWKHLEHRRVCSAKLWKAPAGFHSGPWIRGETLKKNKLVCCWEFKKEAK